MTPDESRAASQEAWADSASAWAKAAAEPEVGASAVTTAWMLEQAELRAGERFLELACGAGRVGLAAAERVGPSGVAVLSDFAEPMVEATRVGAERLGLGNVDARVLDAETVDLGDERFDAVLCRFGFMLMADPAAAMKGSATALVPDGRLVMAVWGEESTNPWLTTIFEAVMGHFDAPAPEPGTPGPFALGDPERVRALLAGAGFVEVEVTELEAEQTYESLDAWWDEIRAVSGPLASLLNALPSDDYEAIRARAVGEATKYADSQGAAAFPATIVAARAS